MTSATISDEVLMALADGELAEADAAAVRSSIARDPALAARFAAFVETRMLLARDPRAPAEEAPGRLVDAITRRDAKLHDVTLRDEKLRGPDVVRALRSSRQALWKLPIAAAIAFMLGGLAGYLAAPKNPSRDLAAAAGILAVPAAQSALAEALDRLPSGRDMTWSDPASGLSGRVAILSSHKVDETTPCREYEIGYRGPRSGSVVAASCRREDRWRTEIAVFQPAPGSGYAPASGASVVEQYLADLGSSGSLSADDEKAAIARGWRLPAN